MQLTYRTRVHLDECRGDRARGREVRGVDDPHLASGRLDRRLLEQAVAEGRWHGSGRRRHDVGCQWPGDRRIEDVAAVLAIERDVSERAVADPEVLGEHVPRSV